MGRPPTKSPDEKLQIVLSVLGGEATVAEAARRSSVSETSVAKWRDQFIDGGRQLLAAPGAGKPSGREAQLEHELEDVKAAVGEAHVEIRVLRKGGQRYRPVNST